MTTVAAILKHKGYQVTTTDPTTTIAMLVNVLAEHRIGAVLVVDRAEQLLGIVSERDIVRCLAANGARTLEMTLPGKSPGRGGVCSISQVSTFSCTRSAISRIVTTSSPERL